jgi:DNA mismatch endonuclease (patch repair protein)
VIEAYCVVMGDVNEAEKVIGQGDATGIGKMPIPRDNRKMTGTASQPESIRKAKPRPTKRAAGRQSKHHAEKYARGTRSYTMSHIHGKDTAIEVEVRRYLFARGLRFRKNDKRYPGHPDVVLPKWHAMVFVNGCFWHAHEHCARYSLPKSNVEYWSVKLLRNRERDREQHARLAAMGWRVIDVWECELNKQTREEQLARLYGEITGSADMPDELA